MLTATIRPNGTINVKEGESLGFKLDFVGSIGNVTYSYGFSNVGGTASTSDYFGSSGSGAFSILSTGSQTRTIDIDFATATDRVDEANETLFLNVSLSGSLFSDGSNSKSIEIVIVDDADTHGTDGRDSITGGRGPDVLRLYDGDDSAFSRKGNDQVFSGLGDDTVRAGAGNDRVFGDDGEDRLFGQGGRDFLYGDAGNDKLVGGNGADQLRGEAGDDVLKGGSGNDTIVGGSGKDKLVGGTGFDTFKFRGADGVNRIMDFESEFDLIELRSGAKSFEDLAIKQRGDNVLVKFLETKIILSGVDESEITQDQFVL